MGNTKNGSIDWVMYLMTGLEFSVVVRTVCSVVFPFHALGVFF